MKIIFLLAVIILLGVPISEFEVSGVKPLIKKMIKDQWIVVLKDSITDDDKKNIPMTYGLLKKKDYSLTFKGYMIEATKDKIDKLRDDDRVLFIEQNYSIDIQVEVNEIDLVQLESLSTNQTIPTGVLRHKVSDIGTGKTINGTVGIVDTGLRKLHPDLNVIGGVNFVGTNSTNWEDDNGHGTHVGGIIGACDNDFGVVGQAPCVGLFALKVCSSFGGCSVSDIISAQEYVIENSSFFDVINLSLGGFGLVPDDDCGKTNFDAWHIATCSVVDSGVIMVVAGGNNAKDATNFTPCSFDVTVCVSALADFDGLAGGLGSFTCRSDKDDTLANFSNFGSKIDIMGSGTCILSTAQIGDCNLCDPTGLGYVILSGTSMSAPQITGFIVKLLQTVPKPTNREQGREVINTVLAMAIPMASEEGWTEDKDDSHERLLDSSSLVKPIQHDVALKTLVLPTVFLKNTNGTIRGTIENIGSFTETFNYTISENAENTTIENKQATLNPNDVLNVNVTWFVPSQIPTDEYQIQFNLTEISDIDDNNFISLNVIIVGEGEIDVESLPMELPESFLWGENQFWNFSVRNNSPLKVITFGTVDATRSIPEVGFNVRFTLIVEPDETIRLTLPFETGLHPFSTDIQHFFGNVQSSDIKLFQEVEITGDASVVMEQNLTNNIVEGSVVMFDPEIINDLHKTLKLVVDFTIPLKEQTLRDKFHTELKPLILEKMNEKLDSIFSFSNKDKFKLIDYGNNEYQFYPKFVISGHDNSTKEQLNSKLDTFLGEFRTILLNYLQFNGATKICWHIHFPAFNFDDCEP